MKHLVLYVVLLPLAAVGAVTCVKLFEDIRLALNAIYGSIEE